MFLISCAGGLANYKARFTVDYEMGMDVQQDDMMKNVPPPPPKDPNVKGQNAEESNPQIKPADEGETYSWSNNAASSDMLF